MAGELKVAECLDVEPMRLVVAGDDEHHARHSRPL
jgi:hypothetical protein